MRDAQTDSSPVPPSTFTTFHLGVLTNADALKDDVKPFYSTILPSLILLTAEYNPVVQSVLQYLVWAEPRPA